MFDDFLMADAAHVREAIVRSPDAELPDVRPASTSACDLM
jgi:hypothetical protein